MRLIHLPSLEWHKIIVRDVWHALIIQPLFLLRGTFLVVIKSWVNQFHNFFLIAIVSRLVQIWVESVAILCISRIESHIFLRDKISWILVLSTLIFNFVVWENAWVIMLGFLNRVHSRDGNGRVDLRLFFFEKNFFRNCHWVILWNLVVHVLVIINLEPLLLKLPLVQGLIHSLSAHLESLLHLCEVLPGEVWHVRNRNAHCLPKNVRRVLFL